MKYPKPEFVHIIINPAPAKRTPLLAILNSHFRAAGIRWDVSITHEEGDGTRLARKAVAEGANIIGAYGGDGTVMEVASALIDSNIPLLILPGGTGNLVAAELRIGPGIERACSLVCGESFETRRIDVGKMGERFFLLRAGAGFESGVIQDATREMKDQFGKWAYVFAALKHLQEHPVVEYEIRLDDYESFRASGVACVVANAGTVGLGRLTLSPSVDVDDGLLDVFFLKKANIEGIVQLAGKMTGLDPFDPHQPDPRLDASQLVNHWHARKVEIHTDPPLDIQLDGNVVARTPQVIEVLPSSLEVVV